MKRHASNGPWPRCFRLPMKWWWWIPARRIVPWIWPVGSAAGCLERPWEDDFSKAKNHGLEQAGHAWILNVDCDEVLALDQTARDLKQTLAAHDSSQVPAYVMRIENTFADGRSVPQEALRLFGNDARIRFSNPIHESIGESLYQHWPNQRPKALPLTLRHYGYDGTSTKAKLNRNIAILRRWVEQEPTLFGRYKLGINLLHMGRRTEALVHLGNAFADLTTSPDPGSYPFRFELARQYHKALQSAGRNNEAQALLQRHQRLFS